mmetsp:Transcript_12428/g.45313  ORF Transcript_12428/g.45313 Transcript_12428/m.45313 type:complete len:86 (+) Transcript_12428:433-690(+)
MTSLIKDVRGLRARRQEVRLGGWNHRLKLAVRFLEQDRNRQTLGATAVLVSNRTTFNTDVDVGVRIVSKGDQEMSLTLSTQAAPL